MEIQKDIPTNERNDIIEWAYPHFKDHLTIQPFTHLAKIVSVPLIVVPYIGFNLVMVFNYAINVRRIFPFSKLINETPTSFILEELEDN